MLLSFEIKTDPSTRLLAAELYCVGLWGMRVGMKAGVCAHALVVRAGTG